MVLDPNGTGTVDVSSAKITSVATPSADTDATKGYVDGVVNGLDVKKSVRLCYNCKCRWYIQQRCWYNYCIF